MGERDVTLDFEGLKPLTEEAQSGAPAAPSCSLKASPGVSEQRLTSGGLERTFRLFVPSSYDGRTPLPL